MTSSTQLVVLRHQSPHPSDPGCFKCHHLYGELHGEHVLIGVDRFILSSTLKKTPTSQEWMLYATNRKMTFQTRTGWASTKITKVPYMYDCQGHAMPVFDLEETDIALNYQYFRLILEPPKPSAPIPAPYVHSTPAGSSATRASHLPKAVEKPKVTFADSKARCRRPRSDSLDAVFH
jgi:hypothetical protein